MSPDEIEQTERLLVAWLAARGITTLRLPCEHADPKVCAVVEWCFALGMPRPEPHEIKLARQLDAAVAALEIVARAARELGDVQRHAILDPGGLEDAATALDTDVRYLEREAKILAGRARADYISIAKIAERSSAALRARRAAKLEWAGTIAEKSRRGRPPLSLRDAIYKDFLDAGFTSADAVGLIVASRGSTSPKGAFKSAGRRIRKRT